LFRQAASKIHGAWWQNQRQAETASRTIQPMAGGRTMKISEVMTKAPHVIKASDSVLDAARWMADREIGGLPVEQDDHLIGMLTDRDIVVRIVAKGLDPAKTNVERAISRQPKYCFEDEDTSHVASNMDELHVRRLPVMNRDKRLVGIVSIEDIRPRKR
jgi:CBS domain-containing protein